jgi:hypothetical protein
MCPVHISNYTDVQNLEVSSIWIPYVKVWLDIHFTIETS